MVRLGIMVLTLLAAGCAGRTIGTEDAGGTFGAGGTSSAGSGGTGGAVASGGSMQGGTGGSIAMGGTGAIISVGGAPGAAAACGMPLVSGPCNALLFAYGFSPTQGHCVRFPYGGCQGNDNRFDTLAECEATCGGSDLGDCPETLPDMTGMCEPPGLQCTYDLPDGCLCVSKVNAFCSKIDPECPPILRDVPRPEDDECVEDDCVSRIVIPPKELCTCRVESGWECSSQR